MIPIERHKVRFAFSPGLNEKLTVVAFRVKQLKREIDEEYNLRVIKQV